MTFFANVFRKRNQKLLWKDCTNCKSCPKVNTVSILEYRFLRNETGYLLKLFATTSSTTAQGPVLLVFTKIESA